MQFLFDSRGRHIANEVSGRLHTPAGVGRFVVKPAGSPRILSARDETGQPLATFREC
jgi:hypothetical protein